MRLFFALWPDAGTRAALAEAAAAVDVRDGRRTRPENLHLTLRFLGEVDAARVPSLLARAPPPALPGFTLTLDDAGWWRASRVAWIAPLAAPAALCGLARGLDEALAGLGFAADPRPFRPHVTVARNLRRAPRVSSPFSVSWRVCDLALVSSVTDPAGPRYEVLGTRPLAD